MREHEGPEGAHVPSGSQIILESLFAVLAIGSLIVISVLTSSFAVRGLESNTPEANSLTAEDALTWSVATLLRADFSDLQTVTTGNMLDSVWLVVLSLGLIGSLGVLISAWIERESDDDGGKP